MLTRTKTAVSVFLSILTVLGCCISTVAFASSQEKSGNSKHKAGEIVYVDYIVYGLNDVTAMDSTINYDSDTLAFDNFMIGLSNYNNFTYSNNVLNSEGSISISADIDSYGTNYFSSEYGQTVYTVVFTLNNDCSEEEISVDVVNESITNIYEQEIDYSKHCRLEYRFEQTTKKDSDTNEDYGEEIDFTGGKKNSDKDKTTDSDTDNTDVNSDSDTDILHKGDRVEVTYNVSVSTGFGGAKVETTYNDDILSFSGVKGYDAKKYSIVTKNNSARGILELSIISMAERKEEADTDFSCIAEFTAVKSFYPSELNITTDCKELLDFNVNSIPNGNGHSTSDVKIFVKSDSDFIETDTNPVVNSDTDSDPKNSDTPINTDSENPKDNTDSDSDNPNNTDSDTDSNSDSVNPANSDTDSNSDSNSDSDTNSDKNTSDSDNPVQSDSDTDSNSDIDSDKNFDSDKTSDSDKPTDSDKITSDTDTNSDSDKTSDSDKPTDSDKTSDTDSDSNSDIPENSDTDTDSNSDSDKPHTPTNPDDNKAEIRYLCGDVNEDGKVTAADALRLQRYAVSLVKLDSRQKLFGDVNGDGRITTLDSLAILRYTVSLPSQAHIGEYVTAYSDDLAKYE